MPKLTADECIQRMSQDRTIERPARPNGLDDERAQRIVHAMANPKNRDERHAVVTLTRNVLRFRDLSHFLREGKLPDVEHVERLLHLD